MKLTRYPVHCCSSIGLAYNNPIERSGHAESFLRMTQTHSFTSMHQTCLLEIFFSFAFFFFLIFKSFLVKFALKGEGVIYKSVFVNCYPTERQVVRGKDTCCVYNVKKGVSDTARC